MTEAETLRAIHSAIGARSDCRVWRQQVGVFVPISHACARCRPYAMRIGLPGQADLLGVLAPHGRLLSIETKSPTGKLTPEQRAWSEMVTRFGGLSVAPARCVADVEEALRG